MMKEIRGKFQDPILKLMEEKLGGGVRHQLSTPLISYVLSYLVKLQHKLALPKTKSKIKAARHVNIMAHHVKILAPTLPSNIKLGTLTTYVYKIFAR